MGTNRFACQSRPGYLGAIAVAVLLAVVPAARAAEESIADLVKLLNHESVFKRVKAARKLGEMGPKAAEALPALRAALQDSERTVRMTAARAIERIAPGPKEKRNIADLAAEAKRLIDGVAENWAKFIKDRENLSDEELKKLIESYESAADAYAAALEEEDKGSFRSQLSLITKRLRVTIFVEMNRKHQKALKSKPKPKPKPKPGPGESGRDDNGSGGDGDDSDDDGPETSIEEIQRLVKELATATGADRTETMQDLVDIGEAAVPHIAGLLEHEDKGARVNGALTLVRIGSGVKAALYVVVELVWDEDASVRARACETIAEIGPAAAPAVPSLVVVLRDKDEAVRTQATRALGKIGPAARAAGRVLSRRLKDESVAVRYEAAEALGELGPAASRSVPALRQVIVKGKDKHLRNKAIVALGKIGPDVKTVVPTLKDQLRSLDKNARKAALEALAMIGAEAKSAAGLVLEILVTEQYDDVRKMAVECIVSIGEPAVSHVVKGLKDERADLRYYAAEMLGRIGPPAKRGVSGLRKLLKDEKRDVRQAAVVALGRIGPEARSAVSALAAVLKEESDRRVRAAAAETLGKIGPKAKGAVRQLIAALHDKDAKVCVHAAVALGAIGPGAKSALETLKTVSDEGSPELKAAAADAIKKIGG